MVGVLGWMLEWVGILNMGWVLEKVGMEVVHLRGHSTDDHDRLLSLRFVINRTGMQDDLLASPLAGRLRMKGVNLQPEFAQGKPVMAEGVGTREISGAPKNWHAIVRESDDAEVCGLTRADVKERHVITEEAAPLRTDGDGFPNAEDAEQGTDSSSSDPDGPMLVVPIPRNAIPTGVRTSQYLQGTVGKATLRTPALGAATDAVPDMH